MKKLIMILIGCALLLILSLSIAVFSLEKREPWSQKVAVIRITGAIDVAGLGTSVKPSDIISLVESANANPTVKAIVLDINSPGGTPVGSDEIARVIKDANKPTVAWIGDTGASGGYWIASAADSVVANPMSITGSIGAYSMLISLDGLMEKVGVSVDVVASGKYKDIGSPFRNATPEEIGIFESIVEQTNENFIMAVAENRNMTYEEVEKLADGKPYTGTQAYELGLVDELGNRQDAINLAGEMGGIEGRPSVIVMEPERPLLPQLITQSFANLGYGIGVGLRSFDGVPRIGS